MKTEIILGRIFLVLAAVLAAFLILEYASRPFISSRSEFERKMFPVDISRHPKPYVMFGGKPHANILNQMGYKGEFPQSPKPEGEYRIFMLGGSTVINGKPPVPQLLEQQFHDNGRKQVKVYNFGVVGSVSGMELARIVFEIGDLSPDLIIMYNGGNDIILPLFCDPRPGYPLNFVAYEANPLTISRIEDYPTMTLFLYGSNIIRSLFPAYFFNNLVPLKETRGRAGFLSEEWGNQIAMAYIQNIIKADITAKAFNADFMLFFQPLVHYKTPLTPAEEKFYRNIPEKYPLFMQRKIRQEFETVKKDRHIKIVDLSGLFENVPQAVFSDHIHIRQEEKPFLAKTIYTHISAQCQIK